MESLDVYSLAMIAIFIVGYFLITIEHVTHINKATVALLIAVLCWALQFASSIDGHEKNIHYLGEHLANISQLIFFIIGALTIVETINEHKGFRVVSDFIQVTSKQNLLWAIGFITFFLSAVLDNLTTTIVMVTLTKKLLNERESRLLMGGGIVIAANAGGAWTPIGDVTTTMLWIGGQITTVETMSSLFLPSMVCFIASFILIYFMLDSKEIPLQDLHHADHQMQPFGKFIFFLGVGLLIFVPIFKLITGLPPFMGILFALSVMWIVTDIVHSKHENRSHLRVPHILSKIDLSSALFFLGILLCVTALESAGLLRQLAEWLNVHLGNTTLIAMFIGLASAVVDNVPLVAASMGMYSLEQYPVDSKFWQLVAYCAGTGGSALIIGSAAGVVFMGLEKADFFWYLRKITIPALVGYFAGLGIYLMVN